MMAASITLMSIGIGALSTLLMTTLSLHGSVSLAFGWLVQEFGMSVPLLSSGLLLARFFGWFNIGHHAQKSALLGLAISWLAHFIMRTARFRIKAHALVS
jgi:hypothetical protein